MSTSRYVDVWCDHPDCSEWCESATAKTAKAARAVARRHGWTYSSKEGDRCPEHSKKAVKR